MDQGFVPGPAAVAYEYLAAPQRYGSWWPRARSAATDGALDLAIDGRSRVRITAEGDRPGTGLVLRFHGPAYTGTLEWYLEPVKDGTVVSAILDLEPARRWSYRRTIRFRAAIRRGLVALRDLAEAEAR